MVVQRGWKHSNDNLHHSSDDSNGSSHTISSSNTNSSRSNYCSMNSITQQTADGYYGKLSQRYGLALIGARLSSESLMLSLELLRINIQQAFNKEIDTLVKKFVEVYFEPAFKNLQTNLGDQVCSEDVLRKMACALLENSKSQYNIRSRPNPGILKAPDSSSARTQLSQQLISALKRPAAQTVNQTQDVVVPPKKPIVQLQQCVSSVNVTTEQSSHPQDQQHAFQTQPNRRRIFWNTSTISTDTKFILDVEANQAFGLGTDGRERLASKHPELIRYLPDDEDRNWLVQEKIIPAQNKNSRFLFLVYDEVIKLSQSENYRNRDNLNLQILHAFKVTNFIIQKMRTFFVDLNIKSRGLITNSFTANNGVSHLRNALLQGSPLVASSVSPPNNGTDNGSANSCLPTSTTTKPKSSLSSQHATLTALLNSNNEAQVVSVDGNNQLGSS